MELELVGAIVEDADPELLLRKIFPVEDSFPMQLEDILKEFQTQEKALSKIN